MTTVWKSAMCGALGGVAGAFAMHAFRVEWDGRAQASPASGIFGFDEEADLQAVDRLWNRFSLPPLSKAEALRAALLLHYAFGAVSGFAYGLLVRRFPVTKSAGGLLFGVSLWIIGDELAISLTRISNPGSKTASSHISALAAHVLFGAVTELSRRSLCPVL